MTKTPPFKPRRLKYSPRSKTKDRVYDGIMRCGSCRNRYPVGEYGIKDNGKPYLSCVTCRLKVKRPPKIPFTGTTIENMIQRLNLLKLQTEQTLKPKKLAEIPSYKEEDCYSCYYYSDKQKVLKWCSEYPDCKRGKKRQEEAKEKGETFHFDPEEQMERDELPTQPNRTEYLREIILSSFREYINILESKSDE